MANILGRSALRATRVLRASESVAGEKVEAGREVLRKGAQRDPELYTLAFVMTGALGLAGYYFASKPTSGTSEANVAMIHGSRPWESGTSGKYQYHPGGDRTMAPRDAPSALHSVIIPNVNLPKHLHEQFNKYDKEEFDDY